MKHRKGRDSISDLNAAATLPATRTNEPRSHVLLFYSVLCIRVETIGEFQSFFCPKKVSSKFSHEREGFGSNKERKGFYL